MAAVAELKVGYEGSYSNGRSVWIVRDDGGAELTLTQARNAVIAAAPTTQDGLVIRDVRAIEIGLGKNGNIFEAVAEYSVSDSTPSLRPDIETGSAQYAFDIGTESKRVFQSLSTVNTYIDSSQVPAGVNTAPAFDGAINVQPDNSIEGVDIFEPVSRLTWTYRVSANTIDTAYEMTVEGLVGKVNDAPFKSRDAGSLLFTGARGTIRTAEAWEISYSFLHRPSVVNTTIGGITNISAEGWDYIWSYRLPKKDDLTKSIIHVPAYVYVERVLERANFGGLGLP